MKRTRLSFKILKQRMIILLLAFAVIFLPQMFESENIVDLRVIFTAIGIDTKDDNFEVSAQVFIPSQSSDPTKPQKSIISIEAPSISEAIDKLIFTTGRLATVGTCKLIVLGKDFVESQNVAANLDYFLRVNEISWSSMLVATEQSALETLQQLNGLEETSPMNWQNFLSASKSDYQAAAIELRMFMKQYYGMSKTSYCSSLNMKKDDSGNGGGQNESDGGSNESGEADASSGGNKKQPQIDMKSKTIVFLDGKKVGELDEKTTEGLNWTLKEAKNYTMKLKDVNCPELTDATVGLWIVDKSVSRSFKWDKEPIVTYKMKVSFVVREVIKDTLTLSSNPKRGEHISKMIAQKAEQEIEQKILQTFEESKKLKADIFDFSINFYKYHPKKYREFMEGREMAEFLDAVKINFDIKVSVDY